MSERAGSRSQENGRGRREAGEGMSAGSGSSAGSGGESDSSASGNEGSAHSLALLGGESTYLVCHAPNNGTPARCDAAAC